MLSAAKPTREVRMQCPKCGGRALCYATKPVGMLKQRYRKCQICGHRFSTWEEAETRDLRSYGKNEQRDLFAEKARKATD